MSEHSYPQSAIIADFGRGAAGLCVTAGPILFIPVTTTAAAIMGFMAFLFIIFLIRTAGHYRMIVQLSEDQISATGWSKKTIEWRELTHLQLRYFAVKKDRSQGWMQLIIKDRLTTLRFDSTVWVSTG
ncbi:MAG: hypothetical protein GKS01_07485 [Alphaproteobacteria bacterium]|nr:hypothetical protein [Alphaproteobacteria bacterium]